MKFKVELHKTANHCYAFFTIGVYEKLQEAKNVADCIKNCAEAATGKESFSITISGLEEVSVGPQEKTK